MKLKQIQIGDVLNGDFKATLNEQIIEQLSGFKSIVIGDDDLKIKLDDLLIGKKYKRSYSFEIKIDKEHLEQTWAGQTIKLKIENANITKKPKESLEDTLKQENEKLINENKQLQEEINKLNLKLTANEFIFKEKILEATKKANETIEAKKLEIEEKYKISKEENKKFVLQNMLEEIATPLNNLLLAVKAGEKSEIDQVKNYCYGFNLVIKQFENALNNNNVEFINPEIGTIFNSEEQEVIETVTSEEHQNEEILQVTKFGFKLNGRVVVPAQVKVNVK
ncbi:nucleotide exchange factor GrpE [Mycoplasmopsis cricetuli]|uniref:nucleotide exchange factor GrpE n=1 Tax=Mycoplasmopsis cricetuli TaxID=171283 RepID=UPI00047135FB|nr:nucleotide exchange factor GrpE [Mycoplasmopsis cricetuli]